MALTEEKLAVGGMTCTGCERNVGNALERIDGVVRARADHRAGEVSVRYDTDRVTKDRLAQEIRATGYDPSD